MSTSFMPGLAQAKDNIPESQTVILQNDAGTLVIDSKRPVPMPLGHQILVCVSAVAINPCDFKMPSRFPSPGAVCGCDFAGTVAAIGELAAKRFDFKLNDRVFGAVHGSNPIDLPAGSFAEFLCIDAAFLFKSPSAMKDETAASIGGTALGTLGLAFYKSMGLQGTLENPIENDIPVLVYGGSTSVGTLALQLLRLSGYRSIAVCSPKNFDLAKSNGAVEVFDYHDAEVAEKIRQCTKKSLKYALDIITDRRSMPICYAALGRTGGRYTCLEAYPEDLNTRKLVMPQLVMGIAILGHRIALDHGYGSEANPELAEFGSDWYRSVQKVLDQGKLSAHPIRVLPGRWDGVLKGIDLLRKNSISAQKLNVRIQEDSNTADLQSP